VWVADRPGYRSSPVGPSPRRTRPDARHSNRAAIGISLCDPLKKKKESPPSPASPPQGSGACEGDGGRSGAHMTLQTRWSPSGAARKMAFLFSGAGLRTEPGLRNAAASPTRKPEDPKRGDLVFAEAVVASGTPAPRMRSPPDVRIRPCSLRFSMQCALRDEQMRSLRSRRRLHPAPASVLGIAEDPDRELPARRPRTLRERPRAAAEVAPRAVPRPAHRPVELCGDRACCSASSWASTRGVDSGMQPLLPNTGSRPSASMS